MPDLELDAGGEKSRTFKQARDHRVYAFGCKPAQPFGHARIFFRKFLGALIKKLELAIVEIEELTIHDALKPRELHLAAVQLEIGNELDRRIDGGGKHLGMNVEPDLEMRSIDGAVAFDGNRTGDQSRLIIEECRLELRGDAVNRTLVDRDRRQLRQAVIQDR